jgi:hypothetical protein
MKATIEGIDYDIAGLSQFDRQFYLRADLQTVQALRTATEGKGIVTILITRSDGTTVEAQGLYQSSQTDLDENQSTGQAAYFMTSPMVVGVVS